MRIGFARGRESRAARFNCKDVSKFMMLTRKICRLSNARARRELGPAWEEKKPELWVVEKEGPSR